MARRNGTSANDVFTALAGGDNETYGFAGNDIFVDGSGNDLMDGGTGNDTFYMTGQGNGLNVIHGGEGTDTLDYSRVATAVDGPQFAPHVSNYGVIVNMQTGLAAWAGESTAQVDHFDGIENVVGSRFDDIIITNDSKNVIRSGGGDDFMVDAGQGDTFDGGAGVDYVSYVASTAAINIDLQAGTAFGGDATGDTLLNVEGLIGSIHGDKLYGNKQDNLIQGNSGKDHIEGREGNDILDGGMDSDMILGGEGDDLLFGGMDVARDVLTGGAGRDTFQFLRASNEGGRGDVITDFEAGVDTLQIAWATQGTTHFSFYGGVSNGDLTLTFDNSEQSFVLTDISAFEAAQIIAGDIEFI